LLLFQARNLPIAIMKLMFAFLQDKNRFSQKTRVTISGKIPNLSKSRYPQSTGLAKLALFCCILQKSDAVKIKSIFCHLSRSIIAKKFFLFFKYSWPQISIHNFKIWLWLILFEYENSNLFIAYDYCKISLKLIHLWIFDEYSWIL